MRKNLTPPCDRCGKRYKVGNTHCLPNMIGFAYEDGTVINVCQSCIMELGEMPENEREAFYKGLGIDHKKQ